MNLNLSLRNVYFSRKLIEEFIRRTPLYYSGIFSDIMDASVYFKLENLQVTGSFKIRGVLNKFLRNLDFLRNKKIVTCSMGNHALAVSYASKLLNLSATVIMPIDAMEFKKERVRAFGANLVIHGNNYDDAESYALSISKKDDYVFVSPYNDIDIILGQATIGLEIMEQKPDTGVIIVPIGGGGLISGISYAVKTISPETKVIGVQSEASPSMYESIKAGKIVKAHLKPSLAEGLHGNIEEGSITFNFVKKYVDEILLVSEDDLRDAIRDLYYKEGILIEGAAAVTLAALKKYADKFRKKKVCLVLSGGNIDPKHIKEIF